MRFFDGFTLALGILFGAFVGILLVVSNLALEAQGGFALTDPEVLEEIDARIEPVGHVMLAGSAELAAAQTVTVAPPPARVATVLTGPQVYDQSCSVCHAPPGLAGAPPVGDGEAWAGRVAKGMDVLTQHALEGFQGETGVMPARGGAVNMSDDEIVSAIEYMLEQLER